LAAVIVPVTVPEFVPSFGQGGVPAGPVPALEQMATATPPVVFVAPMFMVAAMTGVGKLLNERLKVIVESLLRVAVKAPDPLLIWVKGISLIPDSVAVRCVVDWAVMALVQASTRTASSNIFILYLLSVLRVLFPPTL
jgi:hypothetical protein